MTAKEALRSLVDDLDDNLASAILAELEPRLVPDWRKRTLPPSWQEMAAMTVAERDEVFRLWPPDIEMDEFHEWELGTLADADLIDA